jgi:hypothetical protein
MAPSPGFSCGSGVQCYDYNFLLWMASNNLLYKYVFVKLMYVFLRLALKPKLSSLQQKRFRAFFQRKRKECFQNALGYSWRCKFLQRWRCNSRS